MVGDEGPPASVQFRGVLMPNVIDEARGGTENDALGEEDCEGALEGGSCRIRRRPDAPIPIS